MIFYDLPYSNIEVNATYEQCELGSGLSWEICSLSEDKPFVIYDLQLTQKEAESLSMLEVNSTGEYNHYGTVDTLNNEVSIFIEKLGNTCDVSAQISKVIMRLLQESVNASKYQSFWIALRASTAHSGFDTPRWHTDGEFYDSNAKQYKIAIVLKGAQTLFYDLPKENREWFNNLQNHAGIFNEDGFLNKELTLDSMEASRKIIASALDNKKAISAKFGQGSIFLVGSNFAAVHSEPPIHEPRLFLSIVLGTKEQIKQLENRINRK